MEWVEVAGKTIAEATELALDQLGVAVGDAEVIVVTEPKTGLFGRMRVEARVRARVRPVGARPKRERSRDRSRGGKGVARVERLREPSGARAPRQRDDRSGRRLPTAASEGTGTGTSRSARRRRNRSQAGAGASGGPQNGVDATA